MTTVNCPTCAKEVVWSTENTFRPFCSKRCQLIDLGDWASEKNRIASLEEELMSEQLEHSNF